MPEYVKLIKFVFVGNIICSHTLPSSNFNYLYLFIIQQYLVCYIYLLIKTGCDWQKYCKPAGGVGESRKRERNTRQKGEDQRCTLEKEPQRIWAISKKPKGECEITVSK